MSLSFNFVTVLSAALIEAGFGYPAALLDRIKHPVMWIGALLDRLERQLNDPSLSEAERRRNGWIALALLLAATVLPALLSNTSHCSFASARPCHSCLLRQHAHRSKEPL